MGVALEWQWGNTASEDILILIMLLNHILHYILENDVNIGEKSHCLGGRFPWMTIRQECHLLSRTKMEILFVLEILIVYFLCTHFKLHPSFWKSSCLNLLKVYFASGATATNCSLTPWRNSSSWPNNIWVIYSFEDLMRIICNEGFFAL